MSAIFHAFMSGLTLLLVGAELVSLDHPIVGAILLFAGFELAGFGVFACWLERGSAADYSAPHHP
jgi:hypothetical protein